MDHIRDWAREPRPRQSPAHRRVVASVETALVDAGFAVRREVGDGLTNLVASAPGATEKGGIWLVAHSDSVPGAPGAGDDGLGLGVVVETARAVSVAGIPTQLHVLITDGEEDGLLGASLHVANKPAGRRVVLNFDARGTGGPGYMFQTAGPSVPLVDAWRRSACRVQTSSLARRVYERMGSARTDFTVFRNDGWWGYDFAVIHRGQNYHQPTDVPDNLDPRTVQQLGTCALALTTQWLNVGLESPAGAPTAVYGQVLGTTFLFSGTATRVCAVVIGLLGVWAGLSLGVWRTLGGVVAWVATQVVAVGAVMVVFWGIGLPALIAAKAPAEVDDPVRFYALLFLTGAAVAIASSLLVGRGGMLATVWGSVALAVALPDVGYVFLPGALMTTLVLLGQLELAAVAALGAGLVLTPLMYGLFPGLTTTDGPVLVVVAAAVVSSIAAAILPTFPKK